MNKMITFGLERPRCIPAWVHHSPGILGFVADNTGKIIYKNELLSAKTDSGSLAIADIHYNTTSITPSELISFYDNTDSNLHKVKCVLMSDQEVYDLHIHWEFSVDRSEDETLLVGIGIYSEKTNSVSQSQETDSVYDKINRNIPGFVYQFERNTKGKQRFPFVSKRVTSLFGVSPRELLVSADQLFERIHPEDQEYVQNGICKSESELSVWNMSFRVVSPEGRERWLHGIATPERIQNGNTLWHGFIFDITEQKNAEKRLRDQIQKLDEIAFIQAHEFRRPVANMLGIFDILNIESSKNQLDTEQLVHWLKLMKQSVDETDKIIAKIVTKTHLEYDVPMLTKL